jgi:hypothetical protein
MTAGAQVRGNRIIGRRAASLGIAMAITAASLAATAAASGDPPASASPPPSVDPAARPPLRRLQLATTSMMQILDPSGQPVAVLAVRPGETLEIAVTNGARFPHNLYIGPQDALAADRTADLPGVPAFTGGTRTFTWTVPASVEDLWFGCTVVGHFSVMNGRVVAIADVMPELVGLAEADAVTVLTDAGLLAVERLEAADPAVPAGTVIGQEPAAGSPVDPAAVVRYTVSIGPDEAG